MFMLALLIAFWVSLFVSDTLVWPSILYLVGSLRSAIVLRVPISNGTDVVAWLITVLLWPIVYAAAFAAVFWRKANG